MNKTIKKVIIAIILFMTILLLKSTSVFATTYDESQQHAFNEFVNKKYKSTYNLYLGEKMDPTSYDMYYTTWNNNTYSINWYIQPKFIISNPSVIGIENKYELKAKKIGISEVTIELTYGGKTEKKSFKINVTQTNANTKLDSNKNDVVSIVPNSKAKTEVLLANSELWNTNKNSFKITTKETGNVAKYVYSSVYYCESTNGWSEVMITSTLKKDNTLKVENSKEEISVSKVKEISDYGYLTKSRKFYMYKLSKNGKLDTQKQLTGVDSLVGNYLVIKNGKTYAISGKKIFDFEITSADDFSSCIAGLVLNKKGELYYYNFDYGYEYVNNQYTKVREEKYITKKVATKVKCLLGNYKYQTKSGEIKQCEDLGWYEKENNILKTVYLDGNNYIKLKNNNKLYLNDIKILDKVDDVYYAHGTKATSALIVRRDGSIWKLDIAGKAKLAKIRSGKDEYKRISAPTNVTATKSGSRNVKIKWSNVEGAKGYTIYRSTSKKGKYTKIGTAKTNYYKDKGIEIGKAYYYKVVANYSDSSFDSAKSSAAKIKIPKATKKVSATKKSKTSLKVAYEKVSGVTGYEIEYSTSKDLKKATLKDTKNTSTTIKNLKKSKTYYVRVRAYNTINGQKVYSSYSDVQKVVLK